MNNEMINKPPFKVKCIYIGNRYLTAGKEYDVVEVEEGFYKVKNDSGGTRWYYNSRFEIVETPPKDKQEFSVGDMVTINKISDDFVSGADKNVKVGDIATVTMIDSRGGDYDVFLTNQNWEGGWWFSKSDVSFVETPKDKQEFSVGDKVVINKISSGYVPSVDKNVKVGNVATVENISGLLVELSNPNWRNAWWFSKSDVSLANGTLSPQEVVQATLDGKELEIQYTDGTWDSMSPMNTTLHQLTTLNFRLKPETPLEDKRKAVIKKLLTTKVTVLCKC